MRIDVLTPSFGYGRFIDDALDSVALQRGVLHTHIVQDGGSTDATAELLAGRDDPNLVWASEPDEGQSDALNKALNAGDSPWVSWLNADEFYLPNALRHLLSTAMDSDADVVYGDAAFVDVNGGLIRLLPQHPFSPFVLRHYGPYISTCAFLVRRSLIQGIGWRSRYRRLMDWDVFLGLSERGAAFKYVPLLVGAFRVHPQQVTAAPAAEFGDEYATLRRDYGISHNRATYEVSRVQHVLRKTLSGGYLRQHRAAAFRGTPLTWFRGAQSEQAVEQLTRAVYKRRRHGRFEE